MNINNYGFSENGDMLSLYSELMHQKGMRALRRKHKFSPDNKYSNNRFRINRTGEYKDKDLQRGSKSDFVSMQIRSYGDFKDAIEQIAAGEKNLSEFDNVPGKYSERMRLAQSWKDQGKNFKISAIANLGDEEIRRLTKQKPVTRKYSNGFYRNLNISF